MEVALALDRLRQRFGPRERGQKQTRQNRNHRDHHEKLDESEASSAEAVFRRLTLVDAPLLPMFLNRPHTISWPEWPSAIPCDFQTLPMRFVIHVPHAQVALLFPKE